jgi:Protein of unknown function (DUF2786)
MTERERILDRLTKLLAMSKSPNSNEAATAKRMADSLMKKHRLTKADVSSYAPAGFYERPMGSKGFETVWKFTLVTATARFCGCEAISLQVGARRKIRIVGERENVDQAAELFLSLLKTLVELEKIEAAWIADPSILIYSQPKDYANSFRQGATVAIIEMMQRMRPERFGIRKRSASSSPTDPPTGSSSAVDATPRDAVKAEAEERTPWFSKIWPWKKRPSPALPPVEPPPATALSLAVVKPEKAEGEEGYKAKVKSKYAPRKIQLDVQDAADDGAYWRGYQSARNMVVLPSHPASSVDGGKS